MIEKNVIYAESCMDTMQRLPDNSIQCVVTSPPYWGLRDYGVEGQLGLEATPELYVAEMVRIFSEVKRVLCEDGTIWLNLGDTYSTPSQHRNRGAIEGSTSPHREILRKSMSKVKRKKPVNLKPKELVGIPWSVAFALREFCGLLLRQDIIWSKTNPMPSSAKDRCCPSHEYIFMFTKSPKYYYDYKAIREKAVTAAGRLEGKNSVRNRQDNSSRRNREVDPEGMRTKRSVWTVSVKSHKRAHFATFNTELILPCILACSSAGDIIYDPFMGSGTTAEAAKLSGRHYIGSDLNPDNAQMSRDRLDGMLDFD